MRVLGPFEAAPRLAVGVSGGADSLALVLLADIWVRERGGSVLALTVDHGLRPESAMEAARVGQWMAARGIAHAVLRWEGEKPGTGLQDAARQARHRLLRRRCQEEGILHLALAHQLEDQAETLLLRLGMGSGVDGLAAMAPVREVAEVRLLRPLLDLPRSRLEATCRAFGQPWLDDPSNLALRFARGRLRAGREALEAAGLTPGALAETARRAGMARGALNQAAADVLALCATLHPEGWAEVRAEAFREPPREVARRVLTALLRGLGGAIHPPRAERLEGLLDTLRGNGKPKARTLGGCMLAPIRDGWRFVREPAAVEDAVPLSDQGTTLWDRRFVVRCRASRGGRVGALGGEGWAELCRRCPDLTTTTLPAAVRRTLPAVRVGGEVVCVPHLNYVRPPWDDIPCGAVFQPPEMMAGPCFSVVWRSGEIM